MERDQLRYNALAEDWNRLRDYEREWRIFGERVGKFVLVIMMLAGIGLLVGCDSDQRRCDRWTAIAEGYTMCIKDSACKMGAHDYRKLNDAKREAILICPAVRP